MSNLMSEFFTGILEEAGLKKPIYSDKKVSLDRMKDTTQISDPAKHQDSNYISYNGIFSYFSNKLSDQVANKTQNDLIVQTRKLSLNPEVDEALQEIIDEAIVYDEKDLTIELNLEEIEISDKIKTKMIDSFNRILFLLDFNQRGDEIFKQWYVDGIESFEVVYDNKSIKEGIQKLILLTPFNLYKVKDENGIIKYFYHDKPTYNLLKDLNDSSKTYAEDQISQITSGIYDSFQRVHLSPLHKAIKTANQLNLIEDSLIIFRITRSPEKRAFYIDTGNLPKSKAEEYVKSLMNRYRQKKIYDSTTGQIEDAPKKISIMEDYWFPISQTAQGQRGTKIETVQGLAPGFGSFEDVDYFVNKLYRALNVPVSRRNQEARLQFSGGVDIERDELKFFKYIMKLRRRFNQLFIDLLKKDLIAKGVFSIHDWGKIQEKIKFKYANSNEFSTIKKVQITMMKVDAGNAATPLMESGVLSKAYVQKNIMLLSEEDIKQIEKDNEKDLPPNPDGGFGDEPFGAGSPPEEQPSTGPKVGRFRPKAKAAPEEKPEDSDEVVEKLNNIKEGDVLRVKGKDYIFRNGKLENPL